MAYITLQGSYEISETPGVSRMEQGLQTSLQSCLKCALSCKTTSQHCIDVGGEQSTSNHMTLLMDCVDISEACAEFIARSSPRYRHLCSTCALICDECAMDCERRANGDAVLLQCAAACRDCASACREIAGGGHALVM